MGEITESMRMDEDGTKKAMGSKQLENLIDLGQKMMMRFCTTILAAWPKSGQPETFSSALTQLWCALHHLAKFRPARVLTGHEGNQRRTCV